MMTSMTTTAIDEEINTNEERLLEIDDNKDYLKDDND